MAAEDSEFASFVVESLQPLGPVSARGMFGGYGIYLHGTMFALIASDQLYFKVDDGNRRAYEAAKLPHFTYNDKGNAPSACPIARRRVKASTTPTSSAPGPATPYAAALRTKKPKRQRAATPLVY